MSEHYENTIIELSILQSGEEKEIEAEFPSSFMALDGKELLFTGPIHVKGKIYLAGDALIFQFSAKGAYKLSCKVCNTDVNSELQVKNVIYAEDVEEIKNFRFDYAPALRETLFLELPDVIECSQGHCPEREHIKKYLKEERKEDEKSEISYHPFSSL